MSGGESSGCVWVAKMAAFQPVIAFQKSKSKQCESESKSKSKNMSGGESSGRV